MGRLNNCPNGRIELPRPPAVLGLSNRKRGLTTPTHGARTHPRRGTMTYSGSPRRRHCARPGQRRPGSDPSCKASSERAHVGAPRRGGVIPSSRARLVCACPHGHMLRRDTSSGGPLDRGRRRAARLARPSVGRAASRIEPGSSGRPTPPSKPVPARDDLGAAQGGFGPCPQFPPQHPGNRRCGGGGRRLVFADHAAAFLDGGRGPRGTRLTAF